jgi:hypothetical protein
MDDKSKVAYAAKNNSPFKNNSPKNIAELKRRIIDLIDKKSCFIDCINDYISIRNCPNIIKLWLRYGNNAQSINIAKLVFIDKSENKISSGEIANFINISRVNTPPRPS